MGVGADVLSANLVCHLLMQPSFVDFVNSLLVSWALAYAGSYRPEPGPKSTTLGNGMGLLALFARYVLGSRSRW